MRKILMNVKGEFKSQEKPDYFRARAVKMMATVIKNQRKDGGEAEVVVSSKHCSEKAPNLNMT